MLSSPALSRRDFLCVSAASPAFLLAACGGGGSGDATATALASGAVATSDGYSAEVARQVLADGGNAVDAAVATAFALAVTYPEAGNIGGGGFMTLYMDGKPYFLDYREVAPAAATADFYLQFKVAAGKQDPNSSVWGPQAVAVPGTVTGLWEAHQKFGKLPWSRLVTPAVALARDGHLPSEDAIGWRDYMLQYYSASPYPANLAEYFGAMTKTVTFRQPELAATLERIAFEGAKGFYQGTTADLLVAMMTRHGGKGLVTHDDLAQYKPVWRQPLAVQWNGMTVLTSPPPSSGGTALAQLLGMKSALKHTLFFGVAVNSAQYVHLHAEMMKRVFVDRATYMGDPGFVHVPVPGLVDPAYIARRAAEVNPVAISSAPSIQPGAPKMHTTHFSVVDKWGNAVSNTYTLNMPFGSGVVVQGAGFALNDEMDDFATVPGQPNSLGVIGGDANEVAPRKRPLSSMSPTIVLKDGKLSTVIGTPGGPRIFTSVYQVLANLYDYGMNIEQAVSNRRFHHQLPQAHVIEGERFSPIPSDLAADLGTRGYSVSTWEFNTDVQAIHIIDGVPKPFSDPRARGRAVTAP